MFSQRGISVETLKKKLFFTCFMLNIPKVLLHYVLKCLILCEEYIYIYILCLNVVRFSERNIKFDYNIFIA